MPPQLSLYTKFVFLFLSQICPDALVRLHRSRTSSQWSERIISTGDLQV